MACFERQAVILFKLLYLTLLLEESSPHCFGIHEAGRWQGHTWTSSVWLPAGNVGHTSKCILHTHSAKRALFGCLNRQRPIHLILIGDSNVRNLYELLVSSLSQFGLRMENNIPSKYDTGKKYGRIWRDQEALGINFYRHKVRVSLRFVRGLEISSFILENVTVPHTTKGEGMQLKSPTTLDRPKTVVYYTNGLWTMTNIALDDVCERMNQVGGQILRAKQQADLFLWATIPPIADHTQIGKHVLSKSRECQIAYAKRHDITIIDSWSIVRAGPRNWYNDAGGFHLREEPLKALIAILAQSVCPDPEL